MSLYTKNNLDSLPDHLREYARVDANTDDSDSDSDGFTTPPQQNSPTPKRSVTNPQSTDFYNHPPDFRPPENISTYPTVIPEYSDKFSSRKVGGDQNELIEPDSSQQKGKGKHETDDHLFARPEPSEYEHDTFIPEETASKVDKVMNNQKELDIPAEGNKEEEIEEILSEEVKQQRKEEALDFKNKGNGKFKETLFEEAMEMYNQALKICPHCFKKDMAVLFGNRAACLIKLGENKDAIKDCTSALEYDPVYLKVKLRRAQTYEVEEKLDEALKDYQEILTLDRSCQIAGEAVMRLPNQINERNEKLKAEMMGKLKDLGNMCLRPFGLSTDNFQFQQDPNTGGYSVNFQK